MMLDANGFILNARGKRNGRKMVGEFLVHQVGQKAMAATDAKEQVKSLYPDANARKQFLPLGAVKYVVYGHPKQRKHGYAPERVMLGQGVQHQRCLDRRQKQSRRMW